MVCIGYCFHLLCFYYQSVCLICFLNDFCCGQIFIHLCHFFAQQGHFVGGTDFTAHVEGLFHLHTAHIDPSYFIVQVNAGEVGKACGLSRIELSCSIGQKDGQVASGYAVTTVGITVKSCSADGEVGEEVPFVTLGSITGTFRLFHGSRHFLVVF